ncbi:MAG TPA: hypothetical protein VF915_02680 [Reyranella sp.]
MKPLVSRVLAFTRCTAVWFFAVLPFSPSVWSIYMNSSYCFTSSRDEPVYCFLLGASLAPFALIFGPLAGTVDEPINRWPDVLLTALILAVFATTLSLAFRQRSARRPD